MVEELRQEVRCLQSRVENMQSAPKGAKSL